MIKISDRISSEIISNENGEICKMEIYISEGRFFSFENIYDKDDNFIRIKKAYEYTNPVIVSVSTGVEEKECSFKGEKLESPKVKELAESYKIKWRGLNGEE